MIKTSIIPYAAVAILVFCIQGSGLAQRGKNDFSKLHQLVGTWRTEGGKDFLYERWQKVNDSTLRSDSYKIHGKDTTWLENAMLTNRGKKINYVPVIKGENNNEPVVFTLVNYEHSTYTFENKGHDFPQRVIYTLPQGKRMHAWIEGSINGNIKKSDFFYVKVL